MSEISSLIQSVSEISADIRAEVVVGNLLESGSLSENQYIVHKEGQFARTYRRDILSSEETDFDFDTVSFLRLNLSRDSIYDTLPQNMVHSIQNDTPGKGVDTMIKEYRLQQEQQKQARAFFQPFENEMFAFGVETEMFESKFLTKLNDTTTADIFYDFWGMSRDFPPILISKMIKVLPYAHKIVGNIELSVKILSSILKEKVEIQRKGFFKYYDEEQAITLGDCHLGIDFITGHLYDDYSENYQLLIGPLQNSHFQEYIHEGKLKQFVELFCEYFFPLEMEIEPQILLQENQELFEFNSSQPSILGYNTKI